MKHKEIRKKLLRYIDAELPQEESVEIQFHLQHCKQCRKDIELLSGAWNLLQPIKRVQPPPFLWNRISSRLDEKGQKNYLIDRAAFFIKQIAQPALAVAIMAMALFIGIQIGDLLIAEKLPREQTVVTTPHFENEFGLENFRVLSSNSLGDELAALMDYKKQ